MQRDAGVPSVVVSVVEAVVILRARRDRSRAHATAQRRTANERGRDFGLPRGDRSHGDAPRACRAGRGGRRASRNINISLEGVILAGAFGALVGATHGGLAGGFACAIAGGVLMALAFALFTVVWLRADQIITGTAITLLAVGLTGTLYRALYGATGAALTIPTTGPIAIPVLSSIPDRRPRLLRAAVHHLRRVRARPGRLVVDVPHACRPRVPRDRRIGRRRPRRRGCRPSACACSPCCSAARSADSPAGHWCSSQVGTFAENMSAGRGFIAIAIVVLGRWHPVGVAIAALVFGAASALQFLLQAAGLNLPYQTLSRAAVRADAHRAGGRRGPSERSGRARARRPER